MTSYPFPPELETLLREQMMAGGYQSEDDLLRDALLALRELHSATLDADPEVIAGVRRGLDDVKAGRTRPLAEFDAEFRRQQNIP